MDRDASRREFLRGGLGALVSWALLETLVTRRLLADDVAPLVERWARELVSLCADLGREALGPAEWQVQVERLLGRVDLDELLRFIEFERLTRKLELPEFGAATARVAFPRLAGLPEPPQLVRKIFGLRRGRAIIPHGHRNMVSAHLVLRGEFHLRHYDRVADEGNHLLIRPTIDRSAGVGEASSISNDRDNVHWFVTRSESAFTFDVILTGLDATRARAYEIDNLDIARAERHGDELLRVPRIGVEEALRKYGSGSHHAS